MAILQQLHANQQGPLHEAHTANPAGPLVLDCIYSSGYLFGVQNISNGTGCTIDPGGNLNCSGSKNAVVPLDGGKRKVAMSAIESPENWFEDFGSAHQPLDS